MSRLFASASSQYLQKASALVTASAAWSFGCWINLNTINVAQTIMSVATTGSANNLFRLDIGASNTARFRRRDGTNSTDALSTNTVTTGTWYFVGCRFSSATSASVILGTQSITSTTSRSPTGMNSTSIGRSDESTGTMYFDGYIAYPCFWSTALSDAEFNSLAAGVSPDRIQSAFILDYWKLTGASPETPTTGADNLTVTGATYSSNEPYVTGPPGTVSQSQFNGSSATWTNPGNITASDDVYATSATGNFINTNWLESKNFGFSIPTNSTINGIKVEVEHKVDSTAASPNLWEGYLVKAGTRVGTAYSQTMSTTETTNSYGGSTSLFGTTWTPADINSSTFGTSFYYANGVAGVANVSVDSVRITVFFTPAVVITGTLAATVSNYAITASGAETFAGNLASTVSPFTLAATGGEDFTGSLSSTVSDWSLAATGAVDNPVVVTPPAPVVSASSGPAGGPTTHYPRQPKPEIRQAERKKKKKKKEKKVRAEPSAQKDSPAQPEVSRPPTLLREVGSNPRSATNTVVATVKPKVRIKTIGGEVPVVLVHAPSDGNPALKDGLQSQTFPVGEYLGMKPLEFTDEEILLAVSLLMKRRFHV